MNHVPANISSAKPLRPQLVNLGYSVSEARGWWSTTLNGRLVYTYQLSEAAAWNMAFSNAMWGTVSHDVQLAA